jgi:hypothetical protein
MNELKIHISANHMENYSYKLCQICMNGTVWAVIAVSDVRFYEISRNSQEGGIRCEEGEKEETNDNI